MSVESVIIRYRRLAKNLYQSNNSTSRAVADAYCDFAEALEEDIRQSSRVHQDRT